MEPFLKMHRVVRGELQMAKFNIIIVVLIVNLLTGCALEDKNELSNIEKQLLQQDNTNGMELELSTETQIPSVCAPIDKTDETSPNLQAEKAGSIMGFWHESPVPAPDYNERYIFYTNFTFEHYEIVLEESEKFVNISSGTWEIDDSGLILYIQMPEEKITKIVLGELEFDEEYNNYPDGFQHAIKRKIGDKEFWKFDFFKDLILEN